MLSLVVDAVLDHPEAQMQVSILHPVRVSAFDSPKSVFSQGVLGVHNRTYMRLSQDSTRYVSFPDHVPRSPTLWRG